MPVCGAAGNKGAWVGKKNPPPSEKPPFPSIHPSHVFLDGHLKQNGQTAQAAQAKALGSRTPLKKQQRGWNAPSNLLSHMT